VGPFLVDGASVREGTGATVTKAGAIVTAGTGATVVGATVDGIGTVGERVATGRGELSLNIRTSAQFQNCSALL
jgi:hypothetical protein